MNSGISLFNPAQGINIQNLNDSSSSKNAYLNDCTQNPFIPQKLMKSSMVIASAKIPQYLKDSMIQNLMTQNFYAQNSQIDPKVLSCMNQNNNFTITNYYHNQTPNNTRVLFKKEEDEKIKKLVSIFGTRHWDLVAQFMEGRTAKQCRDRYSNYLMPGFFQGEWSDEEDKLLVKLYEENGPRWSIIKKSFQNRSANNIKNRWHYFLHKKVIKDEKTGKMQIIGQKKINNDDSNNIQKNDSNGLFPENQKNREPIENKCCEKYADTDNIFLYEQESEFFDSFNNIEIENDWILFN